MNQNTSMTCCICREELGENAKIEVCPECNALFHGEELALQLQETPVCMRCDAEFEPYTVFELTDRYDIEAIPKKQYSAARGYALNGIFGLFPPKITIILLATIFFGYLFAVLINQI